jgi:type I restriction enzyme S subunit
MSERDGWKKHRLNEVAPAKQPRFPADHLEVWSLGLEDIEAGTGVVLQRVRETASNLGPSKVVFDKTNVLYGKLRPYLRKVVVPDEAGVATSELIPLQPDPSKLEREFLFYYLLGPGFTEFATKHTQGANLPRVAMSAFWNHEICAPSVAEQRRIVARIQDCFSRLDEMEQLQEELDDDLELITDASVRQLADGLRNGHPSLTIGQIVAQDGGAMRSGPFGSAMKHDEFVPEGHLVIGIANVQENRFDPVRKWMINDAKFEVMRRYSVEPGDVLITIMGTIGRTCVVPDDIGSAITSKHVYRIRFPKKRVNPHYVSYLINFDSKTREQLFGTAAGGVMPGLNATKLRDLSIPLPPLKVQDRMVEQLDRTHTALQETRSLHSADDLTNLRTAILREAFAGRL